MDYYILSVGQEDWIEVKAVNWQEAAVTRLSQGGGEYWIIFVATTMFMFVFRQDNGAVLSLSQFFMVPELPLLCCCSTKLLMFNRKTQDLAVSSCQFHDVGPAFYFLKA